MKVVLKWTNYVSVPLKGHISKGSLQNSTAGKESPCTTVVTQQPENIPQHRWPLQQRRTPWLCDSSLQSRQWCPGSFRTVASSGGVACYCSSICNEEGIFRSDWLVRWFSPCSQNRVRVRSMYCMHVKSECVCVRESVWESVGGSDLTVCESVGVSDWVCMREGGCVYLLEYTRG